MLQTRTMARYRSGRERNDEADTFSYAATIDSLSLQPLLENLKIILTSPHQPQCHWCVSAAVPSLCVNNTVYSSLPPSVFMCDRLCESMRNESTCLAEQEVYIYICLYYACYIYVFMYVCVSVCNAPFSAIPTTSLLTLLSQGNLPCVFCTAKGYYGASLCLNASNYKLACLQVNSVYFLA